MGCEGGEEEGDDDDDDAIVHAYSIFVGRRREETFEETARPERPKYHRRGPKKTHKAHIGE
jgi:hypothetical protein